MTSMGFAARLIAVGCSGGLVTLYCVGLFPNWFDSTWGNRLVCATPMIAYARIRGNQASISTSKQLAMLLMTIPIVSMILFTAAMWLYGVWV